MDERSGRQSGAQSVMTALVVVGVPLVVALVRRRHEE